MPTYNLQINVTSKANDSGVKQAQKSTENFGKKFNNLLGTIQKGGVAVAAAGAVFKTAFDLAEQGASINQLTESFELMNDQVFETPDLLEQLNAAARGTIKEADLMAGVLKLTAGTSQELSQQFAQASPRLIEIAKAAQKLNPTLGDTSFLYDSIATGIKRSSPLILDNLGIVVKVGEANAKYAQELGKSVEALTAEEKQMALLNATMEAGGRLIEQVGGNVDSATDSYDRLKVKVGELVDGFKQWLADGLTPVVEVMVDDYGEAVEEMIQDNIKMASSMEELIQKTLKLQEIGYWEAFITGTLDEVRQGNREMALAIAESSVGFEEARKNLEEAFGPDLFQAVDEGLVTFIDLGKGVSVWVSDIKRASDPTLQFSERLEELSRMGRMVGEDVPPALERAALTQEDHTAALQAGIDAMGDFNNDVLPANIASLAKHHLQLQLNAEGFGELESAAISYGLTQEQLASITSRSFAAVDGTITDLFDAYGELEKAQGEWVTSTVNNSGKITEINEQLARDLDEEQRGAYQDILNTVEEGGADWLAAYEALQADLTTSQRQELVARMADLEASAGEAISVYTGDAEAAEAAQERIDAAFGAIAENHRQMVADIFVQQANLEGGFDESAANIAVALGLMTREEANFRLETEETGRQIGVLSERLIETFLEDGSVSRQEAQLLAEAVAAIESGAITSGEALDAFIRGSLQELIEQGGNASEELDNVSSKMMSLPEEVSIKITADTSGFQLPELPEGATYKGAGGTGGGGYATAHGFSGFVPPGYPNDTFPFWTTSGEHVEVTPRGGRPNSTQAITMNNYFNGQMSSTPEAFASRMARLIVPRG